MALQTQVSIHCVFRLCYYKNFLSLRLLLQNMAMHGKYVSNLTALCLIHNES